MLAPISHSVLIVDDEPAIRELLEQALRSSGYAPKAVPDGQAALHMISQQKFELVLLDIRMPGFSGIEVLERISAEHPDSAVIMISGMADMGTAVEAMKLGAYDYISKPFRLDDLMVRVQKALERRDMAQTIKNYQKDLTNRLAEREREVRDMTTQAVQALIREEALTREAEESGRRRKGLPGGADIREFGAKILRRMHGD